MWFTEEKTIPGDIARFIINNSHDYNGDGVSDILLYSTFQQFVGMWRMAANPSLTPPLGKLLFAGGVIPGYSVAVVADRARPVYRRFPQWLTAPSLRATAAQILSWRDTFRRSSASG